MGVTREKTRGGAWGRKWKEERWWGRTLSTTFQLHLSQTSPQDVWPDPISWLLLSPLTFRRLLEYVFMTSVLRIYFPSTFLLACLMGFCGSLHNLGDYNPNQRGRIDKLLTLVYLPWFLAVQTTCKNLKRTMCQLQGRGEMEWSLRRSAFRIWIRALVPAIPSTSDSLWISVMSTAVASIEHLLCIRHEAKWFIHII